MVMLIADNLRRECVCVVPCIIVLYCTLLAKQINVHSTQCLPYNSRVAICKCTIVNEFVEVKTPM